MSKLRSFEDALREIEGDEAELERRDARQVGLTLADRIKHERWPRYHHPPTVAIMIAMATAKKNNQAFDPQRVRHSEGLSPSTMNFVMNTLQRHWLIRQLSKGRVGIVARGMLYTTTELFTEACRVAIAHSKVGPRTVKLEPRLADLDIFQDLPDIQKEPPPQWWDEVEYASADVVYEWMQHNLKLVKRVVARIADEYGNRKKKVHTLLIYCWLLDKGPLPLSEIWDTVPGGTKLKPALDWLKKEGVLHVGPNPNYRPPLGAKYAWGVSENYRVLLPYIAKWVAPAPKKKTTGLLGRKVSEMARVVKKG